MRTKYSNDGQITLESMSQATWYNNWTFTRIQPFLKGDILEIGCGIGSFTKKLQTCGSIYAIDNDTICVDQTQRKIEKPGRVGFGDIEKGKYFFNKRQFNTVVCLNVLEHIQNDTAALKNIYRLLTNKGILILLIPAHAALYGEIDRRICHYRRYSKSHIASLIKDVNLDIVSIRKMNFLGAIGWFFAGKILKETNVSENKLKLFDKIAHIALPLEEKIEPPFGTSILLIAKKTNKP